MRKTQKENWVQQQNYLYGAIMIKSSLAYRWIKQKEVVQKMMLHLEEEVQVQTHQQQCHKTSNVHISWILIHLKNMRMDKSHNLLRQAITTPVL